jgi:hypothetical protein
MEYGLTCEILRQQPIVIDTSWLPQHIMFWSAGKFR